MTKQHTTRPLIYLGTALTNAPQTFLEDIAYLRAQISEHADILDYLGLRHPSMSEVYQWDSNSVRRCDLMVGNLTYPSLGLGMELGIAIEHHKPIISLADNALAPERLLMWGYWDPLHFKLRYKTPQEAAEFVIAQIHALFPMQSAGSIDEPLTLAGLDRSPGNTVV